MPIAKPFIKHKLLIAIIFLLLFLIPKQVPLVHSVSPLEQAQIDYSYQLTKYQEEKSRFDNANANYQTYKTAIAKKDLYEETKDYFNQICDLYNAYFLLVNERTNSIIWDSSNYKKDDQYKLISDELTSIQDIKKSAQNVQKLEDFNTLFKNLNTNITNTGLPTASFVLKTTDIVQIEAVGKSFNKNADLLDKYASSKISDQNKYIYTDWKSKIDAYKITIQNEVDNDKKFLMLNTSPTNPLMAIFATNNPNAQKVFDPTKDLLREILKYV